MTSLRPNWHVLGQALQGNLLVPGMPGYDRARRGALAQFADRRPRAVVQAATVADVVETLQFGRHVGLTTTPRSGGHCFAGRSSGGDIIIDVTPMGAVSCSDDIATVGAGARLDALYRVLAQHGRTVPAGTNPTVGIAGLTLGGGLGLLGRQYGLTADHLQSAQVVLADGRVVDCDEQQNPDLFWALRGAGGGHFGVVTSLVLRTVPTPISTGFHLEWAPNDAIDVLDAWQTWAPTATDGLDATARVTVTGGGRSPVVNVLGAIHETETEAARQLDDLILRVGTAPLVRLCQRMSYRKLLRRLSSAGSIEGDRDPREEPVITSKSEFFRRPLPRRSIADLLDILVEGCDIGQSRQLDFTPWGGAYNGTAPNATAFAHRYELFMVEHVSVVERAAPEPERAAAQAWINRSWTCLRPWGAGGVYPNFPDPDLEDWAAAYYGTNYDRLVDVKRRYDPDDWFRFPQSIGSPNTPPDAAPA